jgi:hypothetical protein
MNQNGHPSKRRKLAGTHLLKRALTYAGRDSDDCCVLEVYRV